MNSVNLRGVSTEELKAELERRSLETFLLEWDRKVAERIGDCRSLPGWDVKNCCAACHDSTREDTRLVEVGGRRICCHAQRWLLRI